ncbi:MAG: hypothetical protein GY749_02855 [Desulfobacteraceae bacterium]|nr:hypothetical protein [Desulfobacteraceae bacterium]
MPEQLFTPSDDPFTGHHVSVTDRLLSQLFVDEQEAGEVRDILEKILDGIKSVERKLDLISDDHVLINGVYRRISDLQEKR